MKGTITHGTRTNQMFGAIQELGPHPSGEVEVKTPIGRKHFRINAEDG